MPVLARANGEKWLGNSERRRGIVCIGDSLRRIRTHPVPSGDGRIPTAHRVRPPTRPNGRALRLHPDMSSQTAAAQAAASGSVRAFVPDRAPAPGADPSLLDDPWSGASPAPEVSAASGAVRGRDPAPALLQTVQYLPSKARTRSLRRERIFLDASCCTSFPESPE